MLHCDTPGVPSESQVPMVRLVGVLETYDLTPRHNPGILQTIADESELHVGSVVDQSKPASIIPVKLLVILETLELSLSFSCKNFIKFPCTSCCFRAQQEMLLLCFNRINTALHALELTGVDNMELDGRGSAGRQTSDMACEGEGIKSRPREQAQTGTQGTFWARQAVQIWTSFERLDSTVCVIRKWCDQLLKCYTSSKKSTRHCGRNPISLVG